MKVILQKDISNLGDAGDIKDVSDGYARNFLLPKKLVIQYNDKSKAAIDHQKHLIKVKKEKRKVESQGMAGKLEELSIIIKAKVGDDDKLFGSVTSMDIAKKLSAEGFDIDKRKIELNDPIKTTGDFEVNVKLDEGITTKLTITVEKE